MTCPHKSREERNTAIKGELQKDIGKCEDELPVSKNQAPWIIIEFIPLGKQGICLEPIFCEEDI
jgi:hypothetical protein